MKATAWAPANIAFIKYWGKEDEELRTPLNDSLSMNMSGAFTVTTVDFDKTLKADRVELLGGEFSVREKERVTRGLDRIRKRAGCPEFARVATHNSFPRGAGSAASASGFAALTVAAFAALGASLPEKDLTVFARLGSGSACRSIPDGFVVWQRGIDSDSSYAYSIFPHDYWDIRDFLVIVDRSMKKVSTTDGMKAVKTSPFLTERLGQIPARMDAIRSALTDRDFARFGEITEEECLDMHHIMQTQDPALIYWSDTTRTIMEAVRDWRIQGFPVYVTIDAGPNVHILCEGKDAEQVREKIGELSGIIEVIENHPAPGAHVIEEHLF